MLEAAVVHLLVVALLFGPIPTSYAGTGDTNEPSVPKDDQVSVFRAVLPVDSSTGKVSPTGDGLTAVVAAEANDPSKVGDAVAAVQSGVREIQEASGVVTTGIDHVEVITYSQEPDISLDAKKSAARNLVGNAFGTIRHSAKNFLGWKPLKFRVTVVAFLALVVGAQSTLQVSFSSNPLESAVALWIGATTGGIILGVEWQNLKLKQFVRFSKRSLIKILFDKVMRNHADPLLEAQINTKRRMFINNTEINLWLFTVFKFIFLATVKVKERGPVGLVTWPKDFGWNSFVSILGSSLGATLVSFPTTIAIHTIHNLNLAEAGHDEAALTRTNNKFQFMTSGAVALRALFVISIILGAQDLKVKDPRLLPSLAVLSGVAGMATMFGISLSYLKATAAAMERKAAEEPSAECGANVKQAS